MTAESLWLALALVLVIEGLFPFLSPSTWRQTFSQLLQLNDGQLRFVGICSMTIGSILIWFLA
nr:DUF2065 domain-containing protein [Rhodoferax sp. PAMC 29310]